MSYGFKGINFPPQIIEEIMLNQLIKLAKASRGETR